MTFGRSGRAPEENRAAARRARRVIVSYRTLPAGKGFGPFEALFPKLASGGVLVRHNAIRYASSMKDYLEAVRKRPDLDTVILSLTMDDGFAVSRRKKK
jgi:hypothetical protein